MGWPVNKKDGFTVNAKSARIAKGSQQALEVGAVVVAAVGLLQQDFFFLSVPTARPILVRPGEAETKIRGAGGEYFLEGPLEDAAAVKPVMPIAECLDAVSASQV